MRLFFILTFLMFSYISNGQQFHIRSTVPNIPYSIKVINLMTTEQSLLLSADSVMMKKKVFSVNYNEVELQHQDSYLLTYIQISNHESNFSGTSILPLTKNDTIELVQQNNNLVISGNRYLAKMDSLESIIQNYQRKIKEYKDTNPEKASELEYQMQDFIKTSYSDVFGYNDLIGLIYILTSSDKLNSYNHLQSLKKACDSATHHYPNNTITNQICNSYKAVTGKIEGKLINDLEFKTIQGKQFKIPFDKGEITILEFWATWCKPCRENMKSLQELSSFFKNNNIELYSISIDDSTDDVVNYLNGSVLPGKVLWDQNGAKFEDLSDSNFIPYNIILDNKGQIVAKNIPPNLLKEFYIHNYTSD